MQLLTRMGWPLSHSCFAYWKLMIFTCNPMFEQCISMDSTPWIRSKQICAASFFSATRTTVQRRRSTVTECSAPLNPWVEPTISKIQVTHNHLWLYCLLAQLFSQSKWGSTLEKSVFFFFLATLDSKSRTLTHTSKSFTSRAKGRGPTMFTSKAKGRGPTMRSYTRQTPLSFRKKKKNTREKSRWS